MPAKLNLFGDDPNELRTRYIEIEASENDRNGMGHADKFESVFQIRSRKTRSAKCH